MYLNRSTTRFIGNGRWSQLASRSLGLDTCFIPGGLAIAFFCLALERSDGQEFWGQFLLSVRGKLRVENLREGSASIFGKPPIAGYAEGSSDV